MINKNDVIPIISQPKNNTNKLPLITNTTILITNKFINKDNRSILGSYLKYEYTYGYTAVAIVTVNSIKLYDTESIKNSKYTSTPFNTENHLPTFILTKQFSKKNKSKYETTVNQKITIVKKLKTKTPYRPKYDKKNKLNTVELKKNVSPKKNNGRSGEINKKIKSLKSSNSDFMQISKDIDDGLKKIVFIIFNKHFIKNQQ